MTALLARYQRDLSLKGYSPRTCKHYISNVKQFYSYIGDASAEPDAPDTETVKDYLYYLISQKGASDSKIRVAHSALRYLVIQTFSQKWDAGAIPQVKSKKKLPPFFCVREIHSLLEGAANLKHRAILTLIYSSGLRLSEAVSLKPSDIKREQMRLLVRHGKGGKDRYTILAQNALRLLEKYWRSYRPETWLFPGHKDAHLTPRACQHAFHSAKRRAGVTTKGGVHALRHSFATHFLECGGGIFQLQKLLGHKALKTTLVYAHVSEENISVISPLDYYEK